MGTTPFRFTFDQEYVPESTGRFAQENTVADPDEGQGERAELAATHEAPQPNAFVETPDLEARINEEHKDEPQADAPHAAPHNSGQQTPDNSTYLPPSFMKTEQPKGRFRRYVGAGLLALGLSGAAWLAYNTDFSQTTPPQTKIASVLKNRTTQKSVVAPFTPPAAGTTGGNNAAPALPPAAQLPSVATPPALLPSVATSAVPPLYVATPPVPLLPTAAPQNSTPAAPQGPATPPVVLRPTSYKISWGVTDKKAILPLPDTGKFVPAYSTSAPYKVHAPAAVRSVSQAERAAYGLEDKKYLVLPAMSTDAIAMKGNYQVVAVNVVVNGKLTRTYAKPNEPLFVLATSDLESALAKDTLRFQTMSLRAQADGSYKIVSSYRNGVVNK